MIPTRDTPSTSASGACAALGGGERAVIVAAGNYKDIPNGTAALLTINRNGFLADTQVRAGPIDLPRAIALRSDSQSARARTICCP